MRYEVTAAGSMRSTVSLTRFASSSGSGVRSDGARFPADVPSTIGTSTSAGSEHSILAKHRCIRGASGLTGRTNGLFTRSDGCFSVLRLFLCLFRNFRQCSDIRLGDPVREKLEPSGWVHGDQLFNRTTFCSPGVTLRS